MIDDLKMVKEMEMVMVNYIIIIQVIYIDNG